MLALVIDVLGRGRVRRLVTPSVPADVLLQAAFVLRALDASVGRLDVEAGTLEARLAVGGVLRLRAEPDGDGSRVAIEVDGRDWGGVARRLARELARGASA